MLLGGLFVADAQALFVLAAGDGLAVDLHQLGVERLAPVRRKQRADRPVLGRGEGADLALSIDHEANSDALHAPSRQTGMDLAPQQRAQRVADQPVEDASRLLGVNQVLIDLPWVGERFLDRGRRDLRKRHSVSL